MAFLHVMKDEVPEAQAAKIMTTSKQPENLRSGLRALRNKGRFSDLTIVCGDEKHNVHKAIVLCQSKWFRAARETEGFVESNSDMIKFPALPAGVNDFSEGDHPQAISDMLDYLYGHDTYLHFDDPSRLAKGYITADKYLLRDMKRDFANALLQSNLDRFTDKPLYSLVLNLVYLNISDVQNPVRRLVVAMAATHQFQALEDPEGRALLDVFPSLAIDLVQSLEEDYEGSGYWGMLLKTPVPQPDHDTDGETDDNYIGR